MDLNLTDRHALVLGATGGLGLSVARALLAEGASVTLAGRNPEKLEAVVDSLPPDQRARADLVAADLATPGAAEKLAAAGQRRLGRVDILINNSGGPAAGLPSALDPAQMQTDYARMVTPLIELTLLLLPAMRAWGWGRILTIASSGVVQPIPHLPASNALRAALAGFMKTLAGEVAAEGVTVNLLAPGRIDTDRVQSLDRSAAQRSGKPLSDVQTASASGIPAGRYGRPAEFGAVAAFLASDLASYVTGSTLRIDGGMIRSL